MSAKSSMRTEVEIFGTLYPVRGHDDSGYLQELAALVDQKMREVAAQLSTVDTSRIAILAALNLSDELYQCRRGLEGERARIKEKVAALADRLSEAMDG